MLVVFLDAFTDYSHTHRVGHGYQGLYNFLIIFIGAYILDKTAINFQAIDRQGLQVTQRRIAGAEIIDGNRDAARMQPLQRLDRLLHIFHEDGFGNFDLEHARRYFVFFQVLQDFCNDIRLNQLHAGDIDRNLAIMNTSIEPAA